MEFTYSYVFFALIPIAIILLLVRPISAKKGKKALRVANANAIKNNAAYKALVIRYRVALGVIFSLLFGAIVAAVTLLARPSSVSTSDSNIYNRDIVFCTDISYSIFDLNLEVIDALKETLAGLHGDRFGVSMFNSSSVTVSPLTEDYSYVDKQLDKISESIKCNEEGAHCDSWVVSEFINNGTIYEAETRGGSLIGDGLVSCSQLFNTKIDSHGKAVLDEERTKIIIFSTDNELGTIGGLFSTTPSKPIFTFNEAIDNVRKKGIIVYGIGTSNIRADLEAEFKAGVEKTGGKYYASKTMDVPDIVRNIDATSKSLLEGQTQTKRNDHPEVLAITLAIIAVVVFTLGRFAKL